LEVPEEEVPVRGGFAQLSGVSTPVDFEHQNN
jgi:hypothetical protein